MYTYKCKMCGGTLDISKNQSILECMYCGSRQTLPKLNDEHRASLYDMANNFRSNEDFDKAALIYEALLKEDGTDAEAYWSLVLCRYGIVYAEEPGSKKRIVTVTRPQNESIYNNGDYKYTLQYADTSQRKLYEMEANVINIIQKNIQVNQQSSNISFQNTSTHNKNDDFESRNTNYQNKTGSGPVGSIQSENARMTEIYNTAVNLMNNATKKREYIEAAQMFETIADYQNSCMLADKCYENAEIVSQNTKRKRAIAALIIGIIVVALMVWFIFDDTKHETGDKNLAEMPISKPIKEQTAKRIESAEVEECITFGKYELDNDISNGKEDIEWLVLDKRDGKALVISKYGLDCQPYNEEYEDTTWEECTLRDWLNNEFMDEVFLKEEQSIIITSEIKAEDNSEYDKDAGNDTYDKVFLLSISEAKKYFDSDSKRECEPTAYAKKHGVYASGYNGNCCWWLRSPGCFQAFAAFVNPYGNADDSGGGVANTVNAVRPAMWINLET